ncbi:MAG: alpha/beta fold hydrolase [Candidatus Aenigmarchaeota archaeon]|nr:alpha/beta fold hydrolase [Candidatus Aenigmarchaeota archaeon]
MEEKKVIFKSQGQKVVGILHEPEHPKEHSIIIIPGFRSTKEAWVSISRLLCKNNFRTLRIDLRGRGESEGIFEEMTLTDSISDVRGAIDFLGTNVGIIGGSYGGFVCIHTASIDKRIRTLDLISPIVDIKTVHGGKAYSEVKKKGFFKYDAKWRGIMDVYTKKLFDDAIKYDSYEVIKKIKKPLIIFHGEKDNVVPFEDVKKFFKSANQPKELISYSDSDHSLKKHEDEVESKILQWFKKWLR